MDSLTSYSSKKHHELVESSQTLSLGSPNLRNKLEDGEIDIFSADKYFSGRIDEDGARKATLIARRRSQDKKAELHHTEGHIKPQHLVQTPSIYSESSWNSQSAFLRRPRNSSRRIDKAPKKKFFANLGCNCACSDENSVDVEDYSDDHNQNIQPVKSGRTRSSSLSNTLSVNKLQSLEEQEGERKSLEVFGSGSKSFGLERRLNMLAWDAIPNVEEIEIQGPISAESIKDTESEASSDLFEIECLSCSANPIALPRHTLEGGDSSCASPTTCYAPSEASVEWSVVTASAADFSEEQASTNYSKMLPPRPKRPTAHVSELPKTRYGGILSGCKSQKAVRVAEHVYTKTPQRENMMKFQMDATQKVGLGSKHRKDLLYIQ